KIRKMVLIKSILIYTTCFSLLMSLFVFYILGVARYVTDFEENTCDMTYMFEYPQYVRISLGNEIEEQYPRYGLYAYGEGFVTEKLRRMYFSGIPVLFIPGNAGSHEQVRSLASVSLRKSLKGRTQFHFDYFTVSLGKDYSALYGGVLMEETVYVSHCIQKILNLYKTNMQNVVLIGHSMGGIIAKGSILLTSNINASVANIIITLATPHAPTLVLDSTLANYYYNLENHLSKIKDAGTNVISIGGGPRDILVTSLQLLDSTADINVLSTNIPDVWKSTDHLSILWCKQLVLSIVRSLFDSVSVSQRPPRISSKSEDRMQALSYHFYHRVSGKKLHYYKETIQFEFGGEWIEDIRRQYTWSNKNLSKRTSPIYLMIRLNGQPSQLTIDTINLESKDWLFICTASSIQNQSRICNWGWNLTNRTRLLPDPLHRLRKVVDLNLQEIKYPDATHIVVRITPDDLEKYVSVNVDLYSYDARLVPVKSSVPLLNSLLIRPQVKKSDIGHIRYYAVLDDSIDVITVELKPSECTNPKHNAIVELSEPWSIGVTQIQFFTDVDTGLKTMKIQTKSKHSNVSAKLRLTLYPACSYTINVQEGVAHGIAVRFLARAIAFSTTWSDWLLGGLNQLPFITAMFVLSIIPMTCGALAMLISVFLRFLNLTRMYEDYLEELLITSLQHFNWMGRLRHTKDNPKEHEDTRQKIFNHLLLFLLWCFTALPAIPSVLVWAKNFSYNIRLSTEDSLLYQSWIVLVACSTLGWLQIPPNYLGIRSRALASVLYFLGWITLLMGAATRPQFYQYYIPPIVAGATSLITLNFIIP
ncbi:GPI inositol-deacylase, partial [Dufourea novaeangliae]